VVIEEEVPGTLKNGSFVATKFAVKRNCYRGIGARRRRASERGAMSLIERQRSAGPGLGFYSLFCRALPLSYRNKIMLIAGFGANVPLLALLVDFAFDGEPGLSEKRWDIGVALVTALVGTTLTLLVLNQLLRPVLATSRALRRYATDHTLPILPTGFTDDAGTLMADTVTTLNRLETMVKDLAHYDQVTGLLNRQHLLQMLAQRLADGGRLALCVVTLRNFEDLSTGFGQAGADAALRVLAERLNAATNRGMPVARLEVGRFAFALENEEGDARGPSARIDRVLDMLRAELSYGEMKLLPEIAVGVALAPDDATNAETLLNGAIAAVPPVAQAAPGFYSPGVPRPLRANGC
jgi:GGDEF domain-containing protein